MASAPQASGAATRPGGLAGLTLSGRAVVPVAWPLYDFANTIFSFAVVSGAIGLYLVKPERFGERDGYVLSSIAIVISVGLNAVVSPILGAISDRGGRRGLGRFRVGRFFYRDAVNTGVLMVRLAPPDRLGEFLGLYGLVGKGSHVIGQLLYGLIILLFLDSMGTGAHQLAVLSLLVTMRIGPWLVWPVRDDWPGSGIVLSAARRLGRPPRPAHVPPSTALAMNASWTTDETTSRCRSCAGPRTLVAESFLTVPPACVSPAPRGPGGRRPRPGVRRPGPGARYRSVGVATWVCLAPGPG